ncbi:MAG: ABC transporter permease [Deltaproteobacteria bacterium]|nr:ABC transporter permease [Deltaproteobacteria bacterium]
MRKIGFYLVLISIWAAASSAGIWESYEFPSPWAVLDTLWNGLTDGSFLIGMSVSLKRIAIGYGLSVILGTLLGMVIGSVKLLDETLGSFIQGLQALPSICWLPLAVVWFGLNEGAILFVVIMGAVLAVAIATDAGIKNVSPIYIRAARNMGVHGVNLYRRVILPAAFPSIVTGMKLGWSFAWRALMAGELLFVGLGLGHLLMVGRDLNDMSQVVAVMLIIVAIGMLADRLLFARLETRIRARWGLAV